VKTRTLVYWGLGYGLFCAINAAIAYKYSSVKGYVPGTNALADFNNRLLPFNIAIPMLETRLGADVPGTPAIPVSGWHA